MHEASLVNDSRAPAGSHHALFDEREGNHGRVQRVAHLVGEHTEPLGAFVHDGALPLSRELGHRAGNGIVQTKIERTKLVRRQIGVEIGREPRDHLADVSIVMHHVPHAHTFLEELVTVPDGALAQLGVVDRLFVRGTLQRLAQLIQKGREALTELRGVDGASGLEALSGTLDDLLSMHLEKLA